MDDGLITSDEHQFRLQFPAQNVAFEPYLFETSHGRIEFVVIEDEMEELNDFFLASQRAVRRTLEKHRDDARAHKSGKLGAEIGGMDVSSEMAWSLPETVIPRWEHIQGFVSRATCLLLVHVLTEKNLKGICDAYTPDKTREAKKVMGLSAIDSYLKYLREVCCLSFEEPKAAPAMRERIRRVRNGFAHGDWDQVGAETSEIALQDAFRTTSRLFAAIEEAVESGRVSPQKM